MSDRFALEAAYNEARATCARLASEMTEIHERAGNDDLLPAQRKRWDDTAVAHEKAKATAEAARVAWSDSMITYARRTPGATTPGDQRDLQVMRRTDPDDPNSDMRSRALAQVETCERDASEFDIPPGTTERSMALIERGADDRNLSGIEQHFLATADPNYARACARYFRDPMMGPSMFTPEEARAFARARAFGADEIRAAMSTTAANGGVLVPHFLDPTINLTNGGANNAIREVADVVQCSTKVWEGVASAGANASWLGEGVEATDASPTFQGPTITTQKAAAWIFGSYEMLADSGFAQVALLIQDAKDRIEETAFTVGTGSGQPFGLITQLSGTGPVVNGSSNTGGIVSNSTLAVADIYALKDQLTPRFRKNATWMANVSIFDLVRQLNTAANPAQGTFWADFGADLPSKLLGKAVTENEAMDSTVVSGSDDFVLLFGDFKQYKVVDRVGTIMLFNPVVLGSNQRPQGQAGWFSYFRTGADVITSNGFRLLRL